MAVPNKIFAVAYVLADFSASLIIGFIAIGLCVIRGAQFVAKSPNIVDLSWLSETEPA